MIKDNLKNILISLEIGNDSFFQFLDGKILHLPLGVHDFGWGCFPIITHDEILSDIRLLVPCIVDEGTLLVNIHEYAHAFELFEKLGSKYIEDVLHSEEFATSKEKQYLKSNK